jgi:hypothetical protein
VRIVSWGLDEHATGGDFHVNARSVR